MKIVSGVKQMNINKSAPLKKQDTSHQQHDHYVMELNMMTNGDKHYKQINTSCLSVKSLCA